MAKLTINQKTAGRLRPGPLSQLQKLHDLFQSEPSISVISSEKAAIASESTPQVFPQFIGSDETSFEVLVYVWWSEFSLRRCISLHCTTQILVLQHVSSRDERGHAGNCRWRITISTCSTPCFIQPLKLLKSGVVCCHSKFNYSLYTCRIYCWHWCVMCCSKAFDIIQVRPHCTLRYLFEHPISEADKWAWFLLTARIWNWSHGLREVTWYRQQSQVKSLWEQGAPKERSKNRTLTADNLSKSQKKPTTGIRKDSNKTDKEGCVLTCMIFFFFAKHVYLKAIHQAQQTLSSWQHELTHSMKAKGLKVQVRLWVC